MFPWILWIITVVGASCVVFLMLYIAISQSAFLRSKQEYDTEIGFIISLSFGTTKSDVLLTANELLAKKVFQLRRPFLLKYAPDPTKHILPLVGVQGEIAEAMIKIYGDQCFVIDYVAKSRVGGNYRGAFDVIEDIILSLDPGDTPRIVIIVVHPAMALRVSMIAARLGLDFIIKTTAEVYDKRSDQLWTRHPVLFYFWEPIKYAVDFWRTREYAKFT